jgi:replicative DNA helicase
MKIRIPTELENAVIGGILLSPDTLVDLDWLEVEHFASFGARAAWRAIRNLEASGSPIDFVTVLQRMQHDRTTRGDTGDTDELETLLGECVRNVPDVAHVLDYATQVRDESISRNVRIELERIANAPVTSGGELLSMAMAAISKLDSGLPEQTPTIHELVKRRMRQLEQIANDRANGTRTLTGFPTGIEKLDDLLGGWQSKIVSIVAARPAMGKSSLGLATADACSAAGFGVHLFSLEDTEEAYADRTVSRASGVPAEAMRNTTQLKREDIGNMARAVKGVAGRHWLVDSRSGITADDVVRAVRKHRKANNTRVVLVDYIQLLRGQRNVSPHERLTDAITTLADAAKADDIAYVVMSQLNRDLEKRQDKRPIMSDLRESGSLEERAKCIVGVYRGRYYSPNPVVNVDYPQGEQPPSAYEFERMVHLLVLKNNNGKTGPVFATFEGATTCMR